MINQLQPPIKFHGYVMQLPLEVPEVPESPNSLNLNTIFTSSFFKIHQTTIVVSINNPKSNSLKTVIRNSKLRVVLSSHSCCITKHYQHSLQINFKTTKPKKDLTRFIIPQPILLMANLKPL